MPTSYQYGKGIVQIKVLLILINTHLLTALVFLLNLLNLPFAESVDVEMMRAWDFHLPVKELIQNSIDNTNTEIITRNNGRGVIIEEREKLETIASNALLPILRPPKFKY